MSFEGPRPAYADRDRFAALVLGLLGRGRALETELDALEFEPEREMPAPDAHDRLAVHLILGALVLARQLRELVSGAGAPDSDVSDGGPGCSTGAREVGETLLR